MTNIKKFALLILLTGIAGILLFTAYWFGTQASSQQNSSESLSNNDNGKTDKDDVVKADEIIPSTNKINNRNKGLTKVTSEIINNKNITELDLSDNQIESLPSQVENWKKLQIFKIENNKLKSLPGEIRHFANLTMLDASGNGMTDLPAEIGQLSKLQTLDLSDNDIDEFPNEILNLKQLKTLDIRNNPVKAEHLKALKENLNNTTILY